MGGTGGSAPAPGSLLYSPTPWSARLFRGVSVPPGMEIAEERTSLFSRRLKAARPCSCSQMQPRGREPAPTALFCSAGAARAQGTGEGTRPISLCPRFSKRKMGKITTSVSMSSVTVGSRGSLRQVCERGGLGAPFREGRHLDGEAGGTSGGRGETRGGQPAVVCSVLSHSLVNASSSRMSRGWEPEHPGSVLLNISHSTGTFRRNCNVWWGLTRPVPRQGQESVMEDSHCPSSILHLSAVHLSISPPAVCRVLGSVGTVDEDGQRCRRGSCLPGAQGPVGCRDCWPLVLRSLLPRQELPLPENLPGSRPEHLGKEHV